MRKFLFNTSVLSALFGAVGAINASRRGPRDWRLILIWIGWASTVAVAVGTAIEDAKNAEDW